MLTRPPRNNDAHPLRDWSALRPTAVITFHCDRERDRLLPAQRELGREVHPLLSAIVHACVAGHSPGLERVETGGIHETRVTLLAGGNRSPRGVQDGGRKG